MTGDPAGAVVLFLAVMVLSSGYVVLYVIWLLWRWLRQRGER